MESFEEQEQVIMRSLNDDLEETEYLAWDEVFSESSTEESVVSTQDFLGDMDKFDDESGDGDLDDVDLTSNPGLVNDSVALYFQEMSREPLLTQDEEIMLAKQMEAGQEAQKRLAQEDYDAEELQALQDAVITGEAARQRIIRANTRLVISIAKRYNNYGLPFLDLIQAGNIGLIKAVDRFDYRQGNKFSTYATWWVRQAITRSLSQHEHTIRIPVHLNDRLRRLYKTSQKMEQKLGRRPTYEEIAAEVDMAPRKLRQIMQVWQQPISLNRPVGEEDDAELGNFIEDENTPAPDQQVQRRLLYEDIRKVLGTLSPREMRILNLRFGLQGNRTHTLREIGDMLGVSRERVRQIQSKALRKLRHPQHRRKLGDYLS